MQVMPLHAKLLSNLKWEELSLFVKWLKCEESTLISQFFVNTLAFSTSKLECHQSTNTAPNKFWETLKDGKEYHVYYQHFKIKSLFATWKYVAVHGMQGAQCIWIKWTHV